MAEVLVARFPEALRELKKLAAKAERYGCPKITWTVGEPRIVERYNDKGYKYKVQVIDIDLEDQEAPRVGDYQFIAKIELTPGGAIIDKIPGEEDLPARYRKATSDCEHCHKDRSRKHVFIVRDPDGQLLQVGRTCLRDYMGTDLPEAVAARFRWEVSVREWEEGLGGGSWDRPVLDVLAVTSAAIRLWGWVPRSTPDEDATPTADAMAVYWSTGGGKETQARRKRLREEVREEDWTRAQEALDWLDTDEAGNSDYIQNLRVICAAGTVEPRRMGYVASLVAAWDRWTGAMEAKRRERESAKDSQWVGEKGKRLRGLQLRVLSSRGFDGHYGHTVLYKFVDQDGNRFSWFCSADYLWDVGDDIVLDATVKDHGEWNGIKETQLTRGRVPG